MNREAKFKVGDRVKVWRGGSHWIEGEVASVDISYVLLGVGVFPENALVLAGPQTGESE